MIVVSQASGRRRDDAPADEAFAALARIPLFRGLTRAEIVVARLGGLTNRNWRVTAPVGDFVLRLAGEGTNDLIDRAAEAHDARLAAEAGVGAEVVFADPAAGVLLCCFIAGAVTMTASDFGDPDMLRRAARTLRRLHRSGVRFAATRDAFATIDAYRALAEKRGRPLPAGLAAAIGEMAPLHRAFAAQALPVAPCHWDPVAGNFLDTDERMYLVDYEFAANGDPMWDLAYLALDAGFDAACEGALLDAYFTGSPPADAAARVVVYRALCDLVCCLWAVLDGSAAKPVDKRTADPEECLARCRETVASARYRRHLG
ncbi:MAG: phosphotransferase, partial [Alphaproteobacteria bacterium]